MSIQWTTRRWSLYDVGQSRTSAAVTPGHRTCAQPGQRGLNTADFCEHRRHLHLRDGSLGAVITELYDLIPAALRRAVLIFLELMGFYLDDGSLEYTG